jgi:hypothetical protein
MNGFPEAGAAWERSMNSKLKTFYSLLAFFLVALYAMPSARPYIETAAKALGAVALIATSLAALPGAIGRFGAALGQDVDALLAIVPKPPTDGSKPKGPPAVIISALAISMLLGGCSWLKSKEPVLTQDGKDEVACVFSHFLAGDSVEDTAAACGGLLIKDVIDLFAIAHKSGVPHGPSPAASSSTVKP